MQPASFRAAYRDDLPVRLADALLHLAAALLVPGPWWLQYVPDLALPSLWVHGMWTDRFIRPDSWLLTIHRFLHLRFSARDPRTWQAFCFGLALALALALFPWLALHVVVHAIIDRCTHEPKWQ